MCQFIRFAFSVCLFIFLVHPMENGVLYMYQVSGQGSLPFTIISFARELLSDRKWFAVNRGHAFQHVAATKMPSCAIIKKEKYLKRLENVKMFVFLLKPKKNENCISFWIEGNETNHIWGCYSLSCHKHNGIFYVLWFTKKHWYSRTFLCVCWLRFIVPHIRTFVCLLTCLLACWLKGLRRYIRKHERDQRGSGREEDKNNTLKTNKTHHISMWPLSIPNYTHMNTQHSVFVTLFSH